MAIGYIELERPINVPDYRDVKIGPNTPFVREAHRLVVAQQAQVVHPKVGVYSLTSDTEENLGVLTELRVFDNGTGVLINKNKFNPNQREIEIYPSGSLVNRMYWNLVSTGNAELDDYSAEVSSLVFWYDDQVKGLSRQLVGGIFAFFAENDVEDWQLIMNLVFLGAPGIKEAAKLLLQLWYGPERMLLRQVREENGEVFYSQRPPDDYN